MHKTTTVFFSNKPDCCCLDSYFDESVVCLDIFKDGFSAHCYTMNSDEPQTFEVTLSWNKLLTMEREIIMKKYSSTSETLDKYIPKF